MAEKQTRKPSASSKQTTTTRTSTAADRKPTSGTHKTASTAKKSTAAKPTTAKKSTSAKKSTTKRPAANAAGHRTDPAQQTANLSRRRTFSEQFMPYVLGAIGIFFGACFLLNFLGDATDPSEHMMGVVGYYICYILLGLFSWGAYLIPLLFFNLAIFWRRCYEEQVIRLKLVLSLVLMILVSAFIHVIVCNGDSALADVINPIELFKTGVTLESGGAIGGLLGFVCFKGLRLPGTIVLALITLPLVLMCLVGVTPMYVFGKIRSSHRAWRQRRAEEREALAMELEEDEDDYEDDEEEPEEEPEEEAPTESYRARRAREEAEAAAKAEAKAAKAAKREKAAAKTTRQAVDTPRRVVTVDAETGEVLEEGLPEQLDPPAAPAEEHAGNGKSRRRAESDAEETFAPLPLHDPTPTPEPEPAPVEPSHEPEPVVTKKPGVNDGTLPWEDLSDEPMADMPLTSTTTAAQAAEKSAAPAGDHHRENTLYEKRPDPSNAAVVTQATVAASQTVPATPHPTANGISVAEHATDDAAAEDGESDLEVELAEAVPTSSVVYEVVSDTGAQTTAGRGPVEVRILKAESGAVLTEGLADEEIVIPTTTIQAPIEPPKEYVFPPIHVLTRGADRYETNDAEIAENTQKLREVLESFRIGVREIECSCGPTITRFEVKPDSGIRVRSIVNLVDDISMGLAKAGVRIEAPIPGKSAVGIEVPNASPAMVYLRNILETPEFRNHKSRIAACLGADVAGRPIIFDIQAMPHMLIAGATGTGKSVCINSIIMSILYKADPSEVKLILIDPKKVEFAMYRDLPHLYAPVVSDPKKAAGALNSAVNEMERRFELIEEVGVRNIAGYNKITEGDPERPPLPQMVIIIDELADLMMTAPAEVETAICRLAQKARAAGIHLVVGTQRPSVDVITGLIKANIPSRIAFAVSSAVDSKIILETTGADKLIGRGDMLFSPIGANKPVRVQGAYVSEAEVEQVVTFIKEHNEKGTFNEDFTREIELEAAKCGVGKKRSGEQLAIEECDALSVAGSGEDPKFWEALEVAVTKDKIGTSALQRALNLGYGRAAKIIDRMEELGFVGPDPGTKQGRKVIISARELAEYKLKGLPGGRSDDDV